MKSNRAKTLDSVPKPILLAIMVVLVALAFVAQERLNTQRGELSHTHLEPLQNAPPMLVLTTQALSGFRGIISSYLWLRANEMQLQKRYQEQMQLSQWVSQLQPTVPTVWVNRAWNMAYNVSVKYPDPETRWKYIQEGVRLLRDEGIKYCPQEPRIYHELAWTFQHKIGHNMDDHHRFFKQQWLNNMTAVLWASEEDARRSGGAPNFEELINPPNEEVRARVQILRKTYKLDPREMKAVAIKYGRVTLPNGKKIDALDWRIPETHSIYWAHMGLKRCAHNPSRESTMRKVERIIYQSMMYAFERGKLMVDPNTGSYQFEDVTQGMGAVAGEGGTDIRASWWTIPNLDIVEKTHEAYQEMVKRANEVRGEDTYSTFETAHFNFMRRAVNWYFYYHREEEARKWLEICASHYPDKMVYYPGYTPKEGFQKAKMNLDEFVFYKYEDDLKRGNYEKTVGLIRGLLIRHYIHMADGDEVDGQKYFDRAKEIHARYNDRFKTAAENRVRLLPLKGFRVMVLRDLLVNEGPLRAAQLRTAMGLKANELPVYKPSAPEQGPSPDPDQ